MEVFGFETIDNIHCLYNKELDLIVLSDIHLGLEGSMTSQGSYVPKFQLEDIIDEIKVAQETKNASRLLINGDLKNEFSKNYFSEKKEIGKFLERMKDIFEEVILIEGNHDNFLEDIVEKEDLEIKKKFFESGNLFIHGHEKPKFEKISENVHTVILGHEHPALSLKDEIGVVEKVDCIIYGKDSDGRKVIVLPAFSKISNGTRINETPQKELLSPYLRDETSIDKFKAVAISREAGVFKFPEIGKI